MDYSQYAEYCRLIGYKVIETPSGVWIGPTRGFFNRVPLYETEPPSEKELYALFRRQPIVGVHYALEPSCRGKASHVYLVRDRDYDLENLYRKQRTSVSRGLEDCQVRQMSFDELHFRGMPLNVDTLTRQRRSDPTFADTDQWARFCQAGERVDGAQAWGAFVNGELAAYVVLFRIASVVSILYQNSRTNLMKLHPNPALIFTVTQTMMRIPGIDSVYYGPGWLNTSQGLNAFKRHMGFDEEPVVSVVRLRPAAKRILFDWGGRQAITVFGRWLWTNKIYQQVQIVLDIAARSL
jgi:hypothetical protein